MQIKFVKIYHSYAPRTFKMDGWDCETAVSGFMWLLHRGRGAGNGTNTFCFSSLPKLPGWHLICARCSAALCRWNQIVNVLKCLWKVFRFHSLRRQWKSIQRLLSRKIAWWNLYGWWVEAKQICQRVHEWDSTNVHSGWVFNMSKAALSVLRNKGKENR